MTVIPSHSAGYGIEKLICVFGRGIPQPAQQADKVRIGAIVIPTYESVSSVPTYRGVAISTVAVCSPGVDAARTGLPAAGAQDAKAGQPGNPAANNRDFHDRTILRTLALATSGSSASRRRSRQSQPGRREATTFR